METNSAYFCQDEGNESLKNYLLYASEMESAIAAAREEIYRREFEIIQLREILIRTIKEKTEAQSQCQKLFIEKLYLQQLLQKHETQSGTQKSDPISGTCRIGDESNSSDSSNNVNSPAGDPIPSRSLPELVLKLAAERPLPEKGRFLDAVKNAGPLLQTLLLAGPLPRWQNPPPPVDYVEIPPLIVSPLSTRLIHQDSFNSSNVVSSNKKRRIDPLEGLDSC